jgi:hypothetical protein
MPVRYSLMGGGQLEAGYAGLVYFSVQHMQQARARVTTLGTAYGLILGEEGNQELDFGLWHRLGDALIPYLGYQLNGAQLGLSYDYTVGKGKSGSAVRNAYELTLIYKKRDDSEIKRLIPWY